MGSGVLVGGHPEGGGQTEGDLEVAAPVVVVDGFVVPVSVSEDEAAHQYIINYSPVHTPNKQHLVAQQSGFSFQELDDLLGGNAAVEIDVQHGLKGTPQGTRHPNPGVVLGVEDVVKVGVDAALLADYFRKEPSFHCEQPFFLQMCAIFGRH